MREREQLYTEQFKYRILVEVENGLKLDNVQTKILNQFNRRGIETKLKIKSSSKNENSVKFVLELLSENTPFAKKDKEQLHDWFFVFIPRAIGRCLEEIKYNGERVVLNYSVDTAELGTIEGRVRTHRDDYYEEYKSHFVSEGYSNEESELYAEASKISEVVGENKQNNQK